MAIGTQQDFSNRLRELVPQGWFSDKDDTPVVSALFDGDGANASFNFTQMKYIYNQQRLQTMTDVNLDIFAVDYFGAAGLRRRQGETDNNYFTRIASRLLMPANSRDALNNAIGQLTGYNSIFFEPFNGVDTGYYNRVNTLAYNVNVGGYGSPNMPDQFFVDVFLPIETGIPNVVGYDNPSLVYVMSSGYAHGAGTTYGPTAYADPNTVISNVTNADVYAVIATHKAAGTIAWVNLISALDAGGYASPYSAKNKIVSRAATLLGS